MDKENLRIPIAIVIAGIFIAGAVYLSNNTPRSENSTETATTQKNQSYTKIRSISATDHIVGNPDANIAIVEYSDTECPACKSFHNTMNRIVTEYAKDGKVAWVYRNMPIDQLHSKSRKEAEAAECVGSLGGPVSYWKMLNNIYAITPSNNELEAAELPKLAVAAGVKLSDFNTCWNSGKMAEKIEQDFEDGFAAMNTESLSGTPLSIIILRKPLSFKATASIQNTFAKMGGIEISDDGKMLGMSGAMPYEVVKMLIEMVLSDK
ncbi:MAG: thioredoxin domain-containing protein [bacterium]